MDLSSTEFTVWSYVAALILLILLTVAVFVLAIVVGRLRKAYRKLKNKGDGMNTFLLFLALIVCSSAALANHDLVGTHTFVSPNEVVLDLTEPAGDSFSLRFQRVATAVRGTSWGALKERMRP